MRKLLTLKTKAKTDRAKTEEAPPLGLSDQAAGPLNCAGVTGNGRILPEAAKKESPISGKKNEASSGLPPGVSEHWVHILRGHDRIEQRYAEEPSDRLSLHVWVCGDREYTATHHRMWFCDGCLVDVRIPPSSRWEHHQDDCTGVVYFQVTPSGAGWKLLKKPPSFIKLHPDRPSSVWWRRVTP
jgi:hypothetical protein